MRVTFPGSGIASWFLQKFSAARRVLHIPLFILRNIDANHVRPQHPGSFRGRKWKKRSKKAYDGYFKPFYRNHRVVYEKENNLFWQGLVKSVVPKKERVKEKVHVFVRDELVKVRVDNVMRVFLGEEKAEDRAGVSEKKLREIINIDLFGKSEESELGGGARPYLEEHECLEDYQKALQAKTEEPTIQDSINSIKRIKRKVVQLEETSKQPLCFAVEERLGLTDSKLDLMIKKDLKKGVKELEAVARKGGVKEKKVKSCAHRYFKLLGLETKDDSVPALFKKMMKKEARIGTCWGQSMTLLAGMKVDRNKSMRAHINKLGKKSEESESALAFQASTDMSEALRRVRHATHYMILASSVPLDEIKKYGPNYGLKHFPKDDFQLRMAFAKTVLKPYVFPGGKKTKTHLLKMVERAIKNNNNTDELEKYIKEVDKLKEMDLDWFTLANEFKLGFSAGCETSPWAKQWVISRPQDIVKGRKGWELSETVHDSSQAINTRELINPDPIEVIKTILNGAKDKGDVAFKIGAGGSKKTGHAIMCRVKEGEYSFYDIYGVGGYTFKNFDRFQKQLTNHIKRGYLGYFLDDPDGAFSIDQLDW